jgi:ribose 5-phosphate isomerase B
MFLPMSDGSKMTVYIVSDHGGFELKNFLVDELMKRSYNVEDLGPKTYNPDDDYPDYAIKVAEAVPGTQHDDLGIIICRNGVGVSIVANKFKGVRCSLSWTSKHAKSARNDDDANVLALPADYIDKETALQISLAFLETPFSNEERHVRRLNKYDHTGNL